MRSLIAPVFCVAALLFVNSGALGQDTQPIPAPTPSAPTPSPSNPPPPWYEELSYKERGQYHPCPASVGLPNGRVVCLGWDDERRRPRTQRLVRRVASWGPGWGCRCCW